MAKYSVEEELHDETGANIVTHEIEADHFEYNEVCDHMVFIEFYDATETVVDSIAANRVTRITRGG